MRLVATEFAFRQHRARRDTGTRLRGIHQGTWRLLWRYHPPISSASQWRCAGNDAGRVVRFLGVTTESGFSEMSHRMNCRTAVVARAPGSARHDSPLSTMSRAKEIDGATTFFKYG